jgi:DNA polymerase I
MTGALDHFREVWLCDFEFRAADGEQPEPLCMVAREWRTGRTLRVWADELEPMFLPPFPVGADSLFVAYYASAELGCFHALGWPMPARVLDLFCEFRNLTNGSETISGNGLLGALAYFGLSAIDAAEKHDMRELALRPGPQTEAEQAALLDYCGTDVDGLARLLPAMLPRIDLPRALLRGRYMAAVAAMEFNGVPIDVGTLNALRNRWEAVKGRLVERIDADFGVYVPTGWNFNPGSTSGNEYPKVGDDTEISTLESEETGMAFPISRLSFSTPRFAAWLARAGIPWPRRWDSGDLALDDDTFRQQARVHPEVAPLRELRHSLGGMRLFDLAVGADGRNRCLLSPFASVTGRNQPSNARFIFGPSCWLRSLIKPEPGRAAAYVDWSQQEFGIAAALSGDSAMMDAYTSGDPYLTFAKQARAVPPDATKKSHPRERDQFKVCALAVQYGMGPESLARSLDQPPAMARELLRLHRKTYPVFWRWSDASVNHAMLLGWLQTVFGWKVHVGPRANPRSLANFPMQANGAEMLRLACCLATEHGVLVCAPVHDALLVEGPADEMHDVVAVTQAAMAEASRAVLSGFELRSDAKIICHPDHYSDSRGEKMWKTVMRILAELPPNEFAELAETF